MRYSHPAISVHTFTGRAVGDLPPSAIETVTWGRKASEVSVCDFGFNSCEDIAADLTPWYHWASAWDGQDLLWTGPIQKVTRGRDKTTVACRDVAALFWRTRVPGTTHWRGETPAQMAAAIWRQMLALHQVPARPVLRTDDPAAATYDVDLQADTRMVNQVMDDLVKIGLEWTVVSGTPVLGPMPSDPIVTLAEDDFLTEIDLVRDGSRTFNDVRVQGQNYTTTATSELAGLRLQTLVSMDELRGVANIRTAAAQYAQQVARIQDRLVIPSGASLAADAPVAIEQLIPGAVFAVYARGVSALMRLEDVAVTSSAGTFDVAVTLEQIAEPASISVGGDS